MITCAYRHMRTHVHKMCTASQYSESPLPPWKGGPRWSACDVDAPRPNGTPSGYCTRRSAPPNLAAAVFLFIIFFPIFQNFPALGQVSRASSWADCSASQLHSHIKQASMLPPSRSLIVSSTVVPSASWPKFDVSAKAAEHQQLGLRSHRACRRKARSNSSPWLLLSTNLPLHYL